MTQDYIKAIQKRVEGVPIASGRSKKLGRVSFDDLIFVPAQLAKRPVDYYREKVSATTVIGRESKKPITLQTPIIFGAMSFGSLSREAKIALAKASAMAGTAENTGEGGVLPEEREFSKHLIIQYSTGRFGISQEVLNKADAIEIKIGQGAKAGAGGFLPGEKVTQEIAKIRKVAPGKDLHSPAYHLDIKDINDLRKKVGYLRDLTGGCPIIIKLAAGDIDNDVKLAVQAEPDVIAIDGMEGGTGAAPEALLTDDGLPTLPALVKARQALDKLKAKQELWIGGGFNTGADFAKALALGADAVFCATALLVAMGCINCGLCWVGKCPKGIATQEPQLRKKVNIEEVAKKVASYIKNCTEEIKIIAAACGEANIHNLQKEHLRALNLNMAKIAKVKLV